MRADRLRLGGGRDDGDVERAAGAADPLEPGGAGEIIGAGHRHRRRRHQPGAQADGGAGVEAGHDLVLVDIDAEPRRQARRRSGGRRGGRSRSAASALDAFDPSRSTSISRARSRRGAAALLGLPPDQAAAERGGEAEDRRAPCPSASPGASARLAERRPCRRAAGRRSRRPVRQPEPGADAEDQADRQPERQLVALGLGQAFEPARRGAKGRTQRPLGRGASAMLGALASRVAMALILGE